jgi:hypothetical protein
MASWRASCSCGRWVAYASAEALAQDSAATHQQDADNREHVVKVAEEPPASGLGGARGQLAGLPPSRGEAIDDTLDEGGSVDKWRRLTTPCT